MRWVEWRSRAVAMATVTLLTAVLGLMMTIPQAAQAHTDREPVGGELRFRTEPGNANALVYSCPLKRTDIDGAISGMFGRIRVRQVFTNPTNRKIEALYVFPLPEHAAVDQMVMTVGKRRVIGIVKEKQEARAVYEAAKAQGKVASLLDQERPNIFTQSVANILPGAKVVIELSLVQTVAFDEGVFTWSFPTVVGPRYIPGEAIGQQRQTARVPDTDRVPDASRLSPPVVPPTVRAGHELGLTLRLDTGGLPLTDIQCEQHAILTKADRAFEGKATITLTDQSEIPNRDFVLHYRIATPRIGDALFTYQPPLAAPSHEAGSGDRYFSLLLTPPRRLRPEEVVPKEMVFVIDRSGSMSGFPIDKAKETMRQAILAMNPHDTFNLLSFDGGTGKCFAHSVPNTFANRALALKYLSDLYGNGGTEMLPAIKEALSGQPEDGHIRVVCFMTDGYIGNEGEIIAAIKKNAGATRVFAFGIGTSVNRFLLDGMAQAGRGAVEYVTLNGNATPAIERFRKRIQSPLLTDISLDFHGLPVYDVYPRQIPDLFDATPLVVFGRIKGSALPSAAAVTLRGHTPAGAFSRKVGLGAMGGSDNDALVSLWARAKVDDLMASDPLAWQGNNNCNPGTKDAVTALGVRYNLLTQFTSFVAVDDASYTGSDTPEEVSVPVETPGGVSYEGAVGASPVFATRRLYGVSGSMKAHSSKTASAGANESSSFSAQPGDPLIRITDAPTDTRLIAAVLPDGTTIPLLQDPKTGAWEAHFDIPLGTAEGSYEVRIYLIRTSGERRMLTLHYRVDTSGALAAGSIRPEESGAYYRLEIETDEEAARVIALLPDGERLEMTRATAEGTRYTARIPASILASGNASASVITFLVTDRAHNRTTITLDGRK